MGHRTVLALQGWSDRFASQLFLMPAVLLILFLTVFPLLVSLYLSLAQLKFVRGGFEINFVGWRNYEKLLLGSGQRHFLGKFAAPTGWGWAFFALAVLLLGYGWWRYLRTGRQRAAGLLGRSLATLFALGGAWTAAHTMSGEGLPGTLFVTLFYVFTGVSLEYLMGLGLALLATQPVRGRRFFRVVYLLPMMITPVGVAYMFRMLTDTSKGPFKPFWLAIGWGNFSWVDTGWGARAAVMIGDIWQWTPFMFIVLLAALESQSRDQYEAALVDGASRRAIFRYVTWPQILPISLTLVLIRVIEAFKIIDLPQVMTRGGPGIATESLTLHSFLLWRSLDLGGSAAVAYMLLFVVTIIALSFVNLGHNRAVDEA
ncbi:MAG: sugar ABC transporter permease [Chloroflexi bacterium]|nr:sugar ABC transporter permease [Chloroflexota bacterium]